MKRLINKVYPIKYQIALAVFSSIAFIPISLFALSTQKDVSAFSGYEHSSNGEFVLLENYSSLRTKSSFDTSIEEVVTTLPFNTIYKDSDELFIGETKTVQQGVRGQRVETFKVYYWHGKLIDRVLLNTVNKSPVDEIILRGTKKNIRELATPDGVIKYYQKLNMWATSYDGNCLGCSGVTYTGTSVRHGVCAVDPRVIPLGSYMYIPGYGTCHAEDIGGGIKGNDIDLGFEDVSKGWWSARYTDVYILEL